MELPILLAIDTTEHWEQSDTVLGASELAIELEPQGIIDGKPVFKKYLLIGDGLPAGPNAARLRATTEVIAGLPEMLQAMVQDISDETARATAAEEQLQYNIEHQETFHDATLAGKGIAGDPLSVVPGALRGIGARAPLVPDGTKTTFPLPENFVYTLLSLVEVNGIGQAPGADYTIDANAKTITFTEAPLAADTVAVYYSPKN